MPEPVPQPRAASFRRPRQVAIWLPPPGRRQRGAVAIMTPSQANAPLRNHAAATTSSSATRPTRGCSVTTRPPVPRAATPPTATSPRPSSTRSPHENAMKWEATEPSNNDYNFTQADGIVAFARPTTRSCTGTPLCGTARPRATCRACRRPRCGPRCSRAHQRASSAATPTTRRAVVGRRERGLRRRTAACAHRSGSTPSVRATSPTRSGPPGPPTTTPTCASTTTASRASTPKSDQYFHARAVAAEPGRADRPASASRPTS